MHLLRALLGALLLGIAAGPARADLPPPPTNQGATEVRVDGTRVTAEAWAIADGRRVESIIVTRLVPQDEGPPKIETYERWSLDGRTKFERGSRALGKAWEKHLWAVLDEADRDRKGPRPKRRELLERLGKALGRGGSRVVGTWVFGWSLGHGESEGKGRRSVGRVGVFTFTPAAPRPDDTPRPPGGGDVTPRDAPARGGSGEETPPEKLRPTTPGAPAPHPPWPLPRPRRNGSGGSFGSGSGSSEVHAGSEIGVREHARVEVDLGAIAQPAVPSPKPPAGEVTPRRK